MGQRDEIERLRQAIAAQEALRGIVPDEQIEATLQALRAQLARYQAEVQGSGAVAQGEGSMAVGQGAVGVQGPVRDAVINTGLLFQIYQAPTGRPRLSEDDFRRFLREYLAWVRDYYGRARLYGERRPRPRKRSLGDIFLPVRLQRFQPPSRREVEDMLWQMALSGPDAEHKAYLMALEEKRRTEGAAVEMADLLTLHSRLAVVGGAGSGKSTLLAYLAWALATHELEGRPLPFRLPEGRKTLVPIVVPLRYRQEYLRLYHQVPSRGLSRVREGTLAGFILWWLKRHSRAVPVADEALAEDFFDRLLRGGGCLVMLDGLDEVVQAEERGRVRAEVENLAESQYPGNLFIVTAREAGYRENAVFGEDFLRLDVQDLEDDQIGTLVRQWCQQLYPASEVERETEDILRAIQEINQRYRERGQPPLIRTPLLVTMVISVKWDETELPRERARLYESVIRVMLQAQYLPEDESRKELEVFWGGTWEEQRDWLSYLAWKMHQGGRDGAAIPEARVREILSEQLSSEQLDRFIQAVRRRGGVLEERAELFQFVHLTFQEFLAARYVTKARKPEWLQPHLADPWWREVVLLTYGFAKMDHAPFAQQYLNWLADEQPPNLRLVGTELAGAAVLDIERPDPRIRRHVAMHLAAALTDPDVPARPAVRARAGDTLAALGDPRFDPERGYLPTRRWDPERHAWADEPTLGFVRIPAGPFLMGEGDKQHEVNLPYDYWIARYPVTVAQWRAFAEATGYKNFAPKALRDPDNRPVRWVTWYNAMAYCEWLNEVLKEISRQVSGLSGEAAAFWEAIASGRYRVLLPSEAEWEKTARGVDGRIYPWGDEFDPDKANTAETGLGTTTTVGAFPRGASPYGVLDLSGNVWEWTRSIPKNYSYDPADGREDLQADALRVVRGGSFDFNRRDARAAVRDWLSPHLRDRDFGVRVVVVPEAAVRGQRSAVRSR